MKKWLRTLSVALLVLPVLAFAACGKKVAKPDPNNDNYQVYRQAIENTYSYAGSYTVTQVNHQYNDVARADGTALTEEETAQYVEDPEFNKQVIAYSSELANAYEAYFNYDNTEQVYTLDQGTFVVKAEDKFVEYSVDETTTGNYVDQNYARETLQGIEIVEELPIGLTTARTYKTYADLSAKLVDAIKASLDVEDVKNAKLQLIKTDDNYTLTVTFSSVLDEDEGTEAFYTLTYRFNKDRLVKLELVTYVDTTVEVDAPVEEDTAEPEQPAEPAKIVYNVRTYMVSTIDFAYSYDASNVPETFDPNGDITNRHISVTYVLDGVDVGSHSAVYGDEYALPEGVVRNNTAAKWYTDEEMTKEFNANEFTYPSNDITLYGRSTAQLGYAVIVYRQVTANGNEVTNVRVARLGYNDADTTLGVTTLDLPEGATLVGVEGASNYDVTADSLTAANNGSAYVVVTYKVN